MPYPTETPGNKHDIKSPRLPLPNVPLSGTELCFQTTKALFNKLKEVMVEDRLEPLAVYSFRDAPNPPLSRSLPVVGVAPISLSVVRRLVGDDDDFPECLSKCVLAVKRGDGCHMAKLEPRHVTNSKGFAKLMQRLRQDEVVAILGPDKYDRFGILKPIAVPPSKEKFQEEDFYCTCVVGKVEEVKAFLTLGMVPRKVERPLTPPLLGRPRTPPVEDDFNSSNDGNGFDVVWKPPDEDDGPTYNGGDDFGGGGLWQPPGSDSGGGDIVGGGLWQPPGADTGGEGGLWQPPGTDGGGDSGGGLWQPPGSDSGGASNGGDFAWQPPESNGFGAWDAPAAETTNGGNTSFGGDFSSGGTKRKADHMEEDDDEKDANGEKFHANKGAAAADAFYSGLTRKMETRADSRLYHMRAFNGWIKATQIQELDPKTVSGGKGPMRVLDLACGKGGDLGKWVLHPRGIKEYVGSDVARGSLKDAAIRARQMRNRLKHCTFTCADLGQDVPGRLRSPKQHLMQKLLTWSLNEEPAHVKGDPEFKMLRGGGIRPDQMFDVVSIQFAIHYMFETRKRARRFFHTVSQLLEVGGSLIATTIDARMVINHLMNLGRNLHLDSEEDLRKEKPYVVKVGGGVCRIQFTPQMVRRLFSPPPGDDMFGLEYSFILEEGDDHGAGVGDAVNLPEWLVPIPLLESLGQEVGLELEYAHNFHEYYGIRKDPSLHAGSHSSLYNMNVLNRNGSVSAEEWEISRMYKAVKFRKVREAATVLEDDDDVMEEEDMEDLDPILKAKLMPMAMMKAKKVAGNDVWASLSPDEKTRLTEVELRKLAKQ